MTTVTNGRIVLYGTLAPRVAHALLPIRGKGSSDRGYAWVPVVGPVVGAVVVALLFRAVGAQSLIDTIKQAAA